MQSGSPKGEQARSYFLACEQALVQIAKERHQWEIERAKGVMIRHILTDTIKMKIAESPNKRFAYPNYTKMIYKAVFGKTLPELQEQFGVKPKESIREYLTAEQLAEVQSVEMLVSSLINIGMGYAALPMLSKKCLSFRIKDVGSSKVQSLACALQFPLFTMPG